MSVQAVGVAESAFVDWARYTFHAGAFGSVYGGKPALQGDCDTSVPQTPFGSPVAVVPYQTTSTFPGVVTARCGRTCVPAPLAS